MSSLPSISHRLFVAALGPRKAQRAKSSLDRPAMTAADNGKGSPKAELGLPTVGHALHPLAARLDSPAFVTET